MKTLKQCLHEGLLDMDIDNIIDDNQLIINTLMDYKTPWPTHLKRIEDIILNQGFKKVYRANAGTKKLLLIYGDISRIYVGVVDLGEGKEWLMSVDKSTGTPFYMINIVDKNYIWGSVNRFRRIGIGWAYSTRNSPLWDAIKKHIDDNI